MHSYSKKGHELKRNNAGKTYTDKRGKFVKGNPGRPRGSRHRITRSIENLLEGQAEILTQKAVDLALAGDRSALRLCMERISPPRKDTPIKFDLPEMKTAKDAAKASQWVLQSVSTAEITPMEGAAIMALIEHYRRTLELCEFEERIHALEQATKE